ncbi:hypothetical protein [Actinomadura madurae]|uniref:hypothetical protein n=1 Tax=Actinomadura madurae TaxID=1993 RepID=UPI0020D236AC|nr:hypothetical protein [Actinomadura madurae]MCQ0018418.1 hypothetical protein [Actinomadura madurae]
MTSVIRSTTAAPGGRGIGAVLDPGAGDDGEPAAEVRRRLGDALGEAGQRGVHLGGGGALGRLHELRQEVAEGLVLDHRGADDLVDDVLERHGRPPCHMLIKPTC